MSQPVIRPAHGGDVPLLAALNLEVQELHFAERPDHFKPPDAGAIEDWFRRLLLDPAARIWVAERDATPLGYVVAIARERPEGPYCHRVVWWEVDQICVAGTYRRGGIGRALLQTVLEEAERHAITQIELTSWAFNAAAHRAFESLGFVPKTLRFELGASGRKV
jgi:GNAT superfamily N-acetyltransferase